MKHARYPTSDRRGCSTCGKDSGTSDCDGCRLVFCARHLRKHRQELAYQLEDAMHKYQQLQQDIEDAAHEHSYMHQIDRWERSSIEKIRAAAENARTDVRAILDRTKRRLTRISRAIAMDLNSSYKADDFLETDLNRWTKQLSELRSEVQSFATLELKDDPQSSIQLIRFVHSKLPPITKRTPAAAGGGQRSSPNEHFSRATHPASVETKDFIAKHIGSDSEYGYVLGAQLYCQGRHAVRLQILHSTPPYMIFLGCIASRRVPQTVNYKSPFAVGWFGHNEIYQHGIWGNTDKTHGYDSSQFQSGDLLCLTFDCDRRQLRLLHERLNKTYKLAVNVDKAPLPWQLLIVLVHPDDAVKILPSR